MAFAFGFELKPAQRVLFTLNTNAKRDPVQWFGDWEAELRNGAPLICVRTYRQNCSKPMADMINEAHDAADQMLDIKADAERAASLCVEPHNNVAWRLDQKGLKIQFYFRDHLPNRNREFKVTFKNASQKPVDKELNLRRALPLRIANLRLEFHECLRILRYHRPRFSQNLCSVRRRIEVGRSGFSGRQGLLGFE